MGIEYTNIFKSNALKKYQNWEFCFENKTSGNPGRDSRQRSLSLIPTYVGSTYTLGVLLRSQQPLNSRIDKFFECFVRTNATEPFKWT
jgi:hypothetical protein